MNFLNKFDIIIIGAGHAGTEAAIACDNMKRKTLLITQNINTIGQMSCNPAIGGIGKSHLVKEIDALGGLMAKAIDYSGIQFKILNSSKGPAVRSTRAQADRILYKKFIFNTLKKKKYITILESEVIKLIIKKYNIINGIKTNNNLKFYSNIIILTVGTFLSGKIHIGLNKYDGGRENELPSKKLSNNLNNLPFKINRLKTGTPPRINKNTINFKILKKQYSDIPVPNFSFMGELYNHPPQIPCYITNTNNNTHEIIKNSLINSPLYNGSIKGIGPRYCPSIEDKIIKFPNRNKHQIFLEPEGLFSNEIYPNGISTSLPIKVQKNIINSIKGLEYAKITRPGYAIEYNFFDPKDLYFNLESKHIKGLFLAGQINGTTGYEEAAAQGIIAGINASLLNMNKEYWYPKRNQSYIGVLINDLCNLGTKEPYRMFTSRAEHRLFLREDNSYLRLTEIAYKIGLISPMFWKLFNQKKKHINKLYKYIKKKIIYIKIKKNKKKYKNKIYKKKYYFKELLKKPNFNYKKNIKYTNFFIKFFNLDILKQIEIKIKYDGYIKLNRIELKKNVKNKYFKLPKNLKYDKINGLSKELIKKLKKYKPKFIKQISNISGITPSAITAILIYIKKKYKTLSINI
ncbi:tRNA uridine 5-carboxymethylaminomethyl modification enzyme MnmG [Candidatus Annandia adelgestsuga]|uniref:tRNA uridine 5-carboxymethylaminomethyl modification enzyme MnmG n=1 Tax=Candidatus Annandia adelgestsuga TaxID=1302411 RepID=A0A3Q9CP38_9ENTR|nr:tRNA uridine-5-carboxymethylaminomethyl(34) synthesis enzyme MnmG [Candidatus Annandia adelgestsuga]AZP36224.1 tRNA uridine 5-carboxymethylaminomethyl modification enzyme MnmG [Candidatus Annandia adelgestsuga]